MLSAITSPKFSRINSESACFNTGMVLLLLGDICQTQASSSNNDALCFYPSTKEDENRHLTKYTRTFHMDTGHLLILPNVDAVFSGFNAKVKKKILARCHF